MSSSGMEDEPNDPNLWTNSSARQNLSAEHWPNGTSFWTDEDDEKTKMLLVKYATAVIYIVIFFFGITGNTLTIYVILANPGVRNKSVSNYYILNLATADELYVATMPLFAYVSYTNNWIFGEVVCKLSTVLRECNKSASVMTLMVLSVDRYLATFHSSGSYRRIKVGVAISAVIWLVSLACSVPQMVYTRSVSNSEAQISCWPLAIREMSSHRVRQLWVYGNLVFGTVLPFAVIASFNVLLVRRLRVIARSSSASDRNGHLRSRMSRGMLRLVLAIVVIFVACQLPYHVIEVISLRIFERIRFEGMAVSSVARHNFVYFNSVAQVLVFVSSCCNPILYGIFNKNYRNLYLQVLCCRQNSNPSLRRGRSATGERKHRSSMDRSAAAAAAAAAASAAAPGRYGLLLSSCLRRRPRPAAGSIKSVSSAAVHGPSTRCSL